MPARPVAALLAAAALLAGCGAEDVDTATYTCGEFQQSFRDKDDSSAGNYIRQLTKRVTKGDRSDDALERQMGAAIAIACGGKPADFKPADVALRIVNQANSRPAREPTETGQTETDDDTSREPTETGGETTETETETEER